MNGGCSPLGPGPLPAPPPPAMPLGWDPFAGRFIPVSYLITEKAPTREPLICRPSMPLGWPVARPLAPMCCYAQPNRVPQYLYLFGMTAAVVTATTGSFAKHATSTATPPPLPLQRGASMFGAASVDPWLMMGSWRLVDIKVVCAGCAVNQAAVGADPRLQVRFYQVNIASNTLFATLDLPCISGLANIGTLDNATGRAGLIYFAQHSFSPPVKPTPFTFLGWQFQNVNTNNNCINSLEVASSALVFKGYF